MSENVVRNMRSNHSYSLMVNCIQASLLRIFFISRKGLKGFSANGLSLRRCVFFASLREIFLNFSQEVYRSSHPAEQLFSTS